jgi:hypothetical protein
LLGSFFNGREKFNFPCPGISEQGIDSAGLVSVSFRSVFY